MYIINLRSKDLYFQHFLPSSRGGKQRGKQYYVSSWSPGGHMPETHLKRDQERGEEDAEWRKQSPRALSASLQKSVLSCIQHTDSFHKAAATIAAKGPWPQMFPASGKGQVIYKFSAMILSIHIRKPLSSMILQSLSLRGGIYFPLSEIWASPLIYFDQNSVEVKLFDVQPLASRGLKLPVLYSDRHAMKPRMDSHGQRPRQRPTLSHHGPSSPRLLTDISNMRECIGDQHKNH